MKEIKISERLEKLLKDRNYNIQNEQTSVIFFSREKENELLKKFDFNESDNIDINDFFQFARYFGIDKELYLEFRTLKKDTKIPLEDIIFEVYDEDNNLIEIITTDKNGEATTKELPINKHYILIEKETQKGYQLSDKEETVETSADLIQEDKTEEKQEEKAPIMISMPLWAFIALQMGIIVIEVLTIFFVIKQRIARH